MEWLWPIKTGRTFFDIWTIEHIAWWIFFSANLEVLWWKGRTWIGILFWLGLSISWEAIERIYFEPHGLVKHPEVWFNSWVSDIFIANLFGLIVGMWIARAQ